MPLNKSKKGSKAAVLAANPELPKPLLQQAKRQNLDLLSLLGAWNKYGKLVLGILKLVRENFDRQTPPTSPK